VTVPLHHGDFVWCAFPEREAPLRPGPMHVTYTVGIGGTPTLPMAIVAYTTSQSWTGARPPGVVVLSAAEAAQLGKPGGLCWICDRWRTSRSRRPSRALHGRLDAIALELATRRPEVLAKLGPLRG
jgi:hypothetical protein